MDAERVEILHRSDGETPVTGIADDFDFNFLPSLEAFLYKYLRRKGKRAFGYLAEGLFVRTDTRAKACRSLGRTYHDREAYASGSIKGSVHRLDGLRNRSLQVYLAEFLYKKVPVFSIHNSFY